MDDENSPPIDQPAAPISGLVPMLAVLDVERSAAFYKLLGFAIGNRVPRDGPMNWAWLYAPGVTDWRRGPNLMLTRSEHEIDPRARRALLYLYAANLVMLRKELVGAGHDPGPIYYPDYLPRGEFEMRDPDGYTLMIAQNGSDTP